MDDCIEPVNLRGSAINQAASTLRRHLNRFYLPNIPHLTQNGKYHSCNAIGSCSEFQHLWPRGISLTSYRIEMNSSQYWHRTLTSIQLKRELYIRPTPTSVCVSVSARIILVKAEADHGFGLSSAHQWKDVRILALKKEGWVVLFGRKALTVSFSGCEINGPFS
jgi:hypothetical protein